MAEFISDGSVKNKVSEVMRNSEPGPMFGEEESGNEDEDEDDAGPGASVDAPTETDLPPTDRYGFFLDAGKTSLQLSEKVSSAFAHLRCCANLPSPPAQPPPASPISPPPPPSPINPIAPLPADPTSSVGRCRRCGGGSSGRRCARSSGRACWRRGPSTCRARRRGPVSSGASARASQTRYGERSVLRTLPTCLFEGGCLWRAPPVLPCRVHAARAGPLLPLVGKERSGQSFLVPV